MGENPLLVFVLMGGLAWALGWPWALLPLAVIAEYLLKVAFRGRHYFRWINSHPDVRSRELTKACHGAGIVMIVMVCLGLFVKTKPEDQHAAIAYLIGLPFALWGRCQTNFSGCPGCVSLGA